MESRGADFVAAVKARIPDAIKSRISPAAKQRAREVAGRVEQRLGRALPVKPPTGGIGRARIVAGKLSVTAGTVTAARAAAAAVQPLAVVTRVDVSVSRWRRPYSGWSGRLGPVLGLTAHSVRLPKRRTGRARVRVRVAKAVPAQQLLNAALSALDPGGSLPSTLTGAMLVDGTLPPWLRASALPVDGRRPSRESRGRAWASAAPMDVTLMEDPGASSDSSPVAAYSRYGLVAAGGLGRILLDISHDNPMGREPLPYRPLAGALRVEAGADGDARWRIEGVERGSQLIVAGRAGEPLDAAQRSALATLGRVTVGDLADGDGVPRVAVLAQLAATGVPIEATMLGREATALLGAELAGIITTPLPGADADPLEWEARSVVQRRAAMRGHDVGLTPTPARSGTALPTVTALVVTRRPHLVARVVEALVAQTYPRLEVVLALHGAELDPKARDELADAAIPVDVLELPGELTLGEALSAATLRARGSLVTKVDDDDQYGPEHIWDLVLARRYSGATVVGKGPEFVYLAAQDQTIRRQWTSETFSNVVAGGTIMIARGDLEAIGGWRPVPRSVDRTLLERVIHAGGLVYRTHPHGFVYTRHDEGHTWDPGGVDFFLRTAIRQWEGLPSLLLGTHAASPSQSLPER